MRDMKVFGLLIYFMLPDGPQIGFVSLSNDLQPGYAAALASSDSCEKMAKLAMPNIESVHGVKVYHQCIDVTSLVKFK